MSLPLVSVIVCAAIGVCAFLASLMAIGRTPRYTATFALLGRGIQKLSAQDVTNMLLALFTGALVWVGWQQYKFGRTTERAYVVFGSRDGTLAEFGKSIAGKRSIKLHFFNGGRSVARHFGVQVHTCAGGSRFSFSQRHRFKGPLGSMSASYPGDESDLGAQAERPYYITDPKDLGTASELAQPKGCFRINGQMEFCDILGEYHCEFLGAEWSPTLEDFVPREFLQCVRENPDPRAFHGIEMGKPVTWEEIEPCEQPAEPEYSKVPEKSAVTTSPARH
jgi:hypothetical protein